MTNLKLARGAGETWTFSVTDDGAVFDLTGWNVDLFEVPAALLGLVTAVIGNAAAGQVTLRVLPGAAPNGYQFWVRLTPEDANLDVATLPVGLTVV